MGVWIKYTTASMKTTLSSEKPFIHYYNKRFDCNQLILENKFDSGFIFLQRSKMSAGLFVLSKRFEYVMYFQSEF